MLYLIGLGKGLWDKKNAYECQKELKKVVIKGLIVWMDEIHYNFRVACHGRDE